MSSVASFFRPLYDSAISQRTNINEWYKTQDQVLPTNAEVKMRAVIPTLLVRLLNLVLN